jgi:hypothetical protein
MCYVTTYQYMLVLLAIASRGENGQLEKHLSRFYFHIF